MLTLPLSIEDEVQTCGTASILKVFAYTLSIPSKKKEDYIVFTKNVKRFEVEAARERFIFLQGTGAAQEKYIMTFESNSI